MFRVGEFARLGQTSVKTVHHYDEIGLLRPSHVDAVTGYRYYTPAQLPRLARILTLKDLGFSLDQIGPLLQADLPTEQIEALLRVKQMELAERVRVEQERLDRVTRRLQRIEQHGSLGNYDVQVKAVPAQTVAAVLRTIEPETDAQDIGTAIGDGFRLLYETLRTHRVRPAGPSVVYWNEIHKGDEGGEILIAAPVGGALPAGIQATEIFSHVLPAVSQMATVTYHGSLLGVEDAYIALIAWIEENGYRICGPHRDVILHYAGSSDGDSVNEAQFPVTRDLPSPAGVASH
ncbi:MAG: MerR family transcriptional regulator [Akkermansiaceae bacterium]|nr:MerR family transcriptional regulator [Armatimonadota bacterium]